MKCIGKKADGTNCKAQAQVDFFTCIRHRDQEPEVNPKRVDTKECAKEARTIRFGSSSENHSHVLPVYDPDTGKMTKERIRCNFRNGHFATSDEQTIKGLREHIEKFPNDHKLCEL